MVAAKQCILLFCIFPFLAACAGDAPKAASESSNAAVAQAAVDPFASADSSLNDGFRKLEARIDGRIGVAAIHLESGWSMSYRGKETFPMASVGKLPMALRFLRMVDAGAFRLDSTVTLGAGDHRPGGSILYHRCMRQGGTTTLHALLEATLVSSDNTACDYLLRLAGGPGSVDSLMTSLGLDDIDISHSEGDLILLWAGVDPKIVDSTWTRDRFYAKIAEAGDSAWRTAEARLVNAPSDAAPPEEIATLLAMLWNRRLLSAATTDTLSAIMSRAVTGRGRIAGLLPPETLVAHKTGTISSTTNDVGVIMLPNGERLAIAVFVKGSRVGVRARERAIAEAAHLVYRQVTEIAAGARSTSTTQPVSAQRSER